MKGLDLYATVISDWGGMLCYPSCWPVISLKVWWQHQIQIGNSKYILLEPISHLENAFWSHLYILIISLFLGKILSRFRLRIFKKIFWILKFFGLRQNLTRQLQAQIKKGCSKFWICHTFKNFLNCGTNSTFKKRWADNVLIFFFISHSTHFWRENFGILEFFFRQNFYW